MNKTMYLTVSVGNSDNKLTQQEWNKFVEEMIDVIASNGKVHFFGGSSTFAPWQNCAWIVEITPEKFGKLPDLIEPIRKRYRQDSIFMLFGDGVFFGE